MKVDNFDQANNISKAIQTAFEKGKALGKLQLKHSIEQLMDGAVNG